MPITPPMYVAAPPVTPYGGGLFSAAVFPPAPASPHWQNGVQWEPYGCDEAKGTRDACTTPAPDAKSLERGVPLEEADPFTVYAGYDCAAVGRASADTFDRARQALILGEARTVERLFWEGGQQNSPILAEPTTTILGSSTEGSSMVGAVARLETWLGENYGGTGVIHAPRGVGIYAARDSLVVGDAGGSSRTPLGTRWAFGGGYVSNTGPDGTVAPSGTAWLYATGQVVIWRSEIFTNPDEAHAIDRTTNDLVIIAERTYVIGYECGKVATLACLD